MLGPAALKHSGKTVVLPVGWPVFKSTMLNVSLGTSSDNFDLPLYYFLAGAGACFFLECLT